MSSIFPTRIALVTLDSLDVSYMPDSIWVDLTGPECDQGGLSPSCTAALPHSFFCNPPPWWIRDFTH